MRLIANMVGKNEADRFLPEVLDHLHPIVDKIVFTDDFSSDNTMELVGSYEKASVYGTGFGRSMFSEDEGKLRSVAWNNLEQHAKEGDWILAIDCDEKLWRATDKVNVDALLEQDRFDVLGVKFFHMWNEKEFRTDKLWTPNISSRLFRFFDGGRFLDRRLACGSEPTYVTDTIRGRRRFLPTPGLFMQHLGYLKDEDKKAKHVRYMSIDKGEFHNIRHIESIVDDDVSLYPWSATLLEAR